MINGWEKKIENKKGKEDYLIQKQSADLEETYTEEVNIPEIDKFNRRISHANHHLISLSLAGLVPAKFLAWCLCLSLDVKRTPDTSAKK